MRSEQARDPAAHTRNVCQRLAEVREHLRRDIEVVEEPQFRAMCETAAEVIGGLEKTFSDYEKKNETAWQASKD